MSPVKGRGLMRKKVGTRLIIATLGAAIVVALPFVTGKLVTELLSTYLIFSLVALSLDLIWGYTGILSIGQFVFFGIGAYSAALITTHLTSAGALSLGLGYVVAVILPAVIALVLAYIFFTVKLDELFVLVTIAMAIIAENLAVSQTILLGGLNGIILPYWVVPANTTVFFYILVAVIACVYAVSRFVVSSPFGKVLLGIRDSEKRTQFLGYDTRAYKVAVYTLAAAISGLAGALYANLGGFVSPSVLGFSLSFDAVVWAALGGLGTLYGPILGTILVSWAKFYLSGVLLDYWILVVGFLFIIVVIFFPEGFAGMIRRARHRLSGARNSGGTDA